MSNSREEELALLAGKYIGSGIQHVDMTSDVLIRKITDCLDDIKAFAKNSLTMNSVVERLDDMKTSLQFSALPDDNGRLFCWQIQLY